MNNLIESASASDCEAIAKIHFESMRVAYAGKLPQEYLDAPVTQWRVNAWKKWIARKKVHTFVVKEAKTNVGFCTLQPFIEEGSNNSAAEIVALFVTPEQWRRGLGAGLCRAAERAAIDSDYREMALWVLEENRDAQRFYEAQGYELQNKDRVFLETTNEPLLEVMYRKSLV